MDFSFDLIPPTKYWEKHTPTKERNNNSLFSIRARKLILLALQLCSTPYNDQSMMIHWIVFARVICTKPPRLIFVCSIRAVLVAVTNPSLRNLHVCDFAFLLLLIIVRPGGHNNADPDIGTHFGSTPWQSLFWLFETFFWERKSQVERKSFIGKAKYGNFHLCQICWRCLAVNLILSPRTIRVTITNPAGRDASAAPTLNVRYGHH